MWVRFEKEQVFIVTLAKLEWNQNKTVRTHIQISI